VLDGIVRATGIRLNGDHAKLAADLSMARTWYRSHLKTTAEKTSLRKRLRAISAHARALRTALADDEARLLLRGLYEGGVDPIEELPSAKDAAVTVTLSAEVIGRAVLDARRLHERMTAEVPARSPRPSWLSKGSALENLIGNDLLRLFTRYFGQPHGLTRHTNGRPKETAFTRFVGATLSAFAIKGANNKPVALETVYRAVSRMASTKPNNSRRARARALGAHRSEK
jgi:hypothetical protein